MNDDYGPCRFNSCLVFFAGMFTSLVCFGWIFFTKKKSQDRIIESEPPCKNTMAVIEAMSKYSRDKKDFWGAAGNIATIVAVLIAVAALWTSGQEVQQMKAEVEEMRQANQLSAVPNVAFQRVFVATAKYPNPGLYLINYGPGLAILDSYRVYVDGQVVPEGWKVAAQRLGLDTFPEFRLSTPARILPAGYESMIMLVGFETEDWQLEHRDKLAIAFSQLRMEIDYQSVYEVDYTANLVEFNQD